MVGIKAMSDCSRIASKRTEVVVTTVIVVLQLINSS